MNEKHVQAITIAMKLIKDYAVTDIDTLADYEALCWADHGYLDEAEKTAHISPLIQSIIATLKSMMWYCEGDCKKWLPKDKLEIVDDPLTATFEGRYAYRCKVCLCHLGDLT